MDTFLAIGLIDGCIGWLGALALIVIGFVVGRQGDAGAGFAVAGAGAIKLLLNCCAMAPSFAYRFGVDFDDTAFDVNLVLIQLQRLAFFGLLAFAITRLGGAPEDAS